MVGEFHLTCVSWKSGGLEGHDIKEHLLRVGGDHADRAIADLHRRPFITLPAEEECARRWKARCAFSDDGFQPLHRFLIRSAADVARAVIVIIGEYPADFTIPLGGAFPIRPNFPQAPNLF